VPKADRLQWLRRLPDHERVELANLPTPIQRLPRLSAKLGGPEIWMKRDDLTGLPGGGNKTRKLEFLIADALRQGADILLTIGAIQSNHTRQTAAAAAKVGIECALLHCHWAPDGGPHYRQVGNVLMSALVGAQLYLDDTARPVGDETSLGLLAEQLRTEGRTPYLIPCGASDHPLGGLGYAAAAGEILSQSDDMGLTFDAIVHCTGSSSTQAGLLAGLAAADSRIRVIGVADDGERLEKLDRVSRLARDTLTGLGVKTLVSNPQVEVIVTDTADYGVASERTVDAIRLLAETEGIVTDPVYEGKAVRGLINLIDAGDLRKGQRVLLMHLGGVPAVDAYAENLWRVEMKPFQVPLKDREGSLQAASRYQA